MARRLPEDVKQTCLWLAKGYERRLAKYQSERGGGRKGERRRTRERERLEAVEQALVAVGEDIPAEEVREQLRKAIMLNIESGRKYPYEQLSLEVISRSDFDRRKDKFLADIAERMAL